MATHIEYGNIRFHNCLTRQWQQEVRYDESGTDMLYSVIRATFQGIAHLQYPEGETLADAVCWIGPLTTYGEEIADTAALVHLIRKELTEPRLPFRMFIDDALMLEVGPADAFAGNFVYRDANNGPKPVDVVVQSITGSRLFNVAFTIELAVFPDCLEREAKANRGAVVVSNRWSVAETLDGSFFTTRTIHGRMRISHPTLPASVFKHIVIPTLENGFRRDSIEFTVAANGLDCEYTVRDVQSRDAPPWPAARWSIVHRETTNDGVTWFTDIAIRLDGAPSTPKAYLMMRAMQIILNRMNWEDRGFRDLQTKAFIEGLAFVDHIGDKNTIEVQFRVRRLIEESRNDVVSAVKKRFGTPLKLPPLTIAGYQSERKGWPPLHDVTKHPIPALFGYNPHGGLRHPAALLMLHCYLQHPCTNHGAWQASPAPPPKERETGRAETPTIAGQEVEQLPEMGENLVAEEAKKLVYTFAAAVTSYAQDETVVGLPIAVDEDSDDEVREATRFVRLAAPQATMTIHFEVEAVGGPPSIPEPVRTWEQKTVRGTLRGRLLHVEQTFAAPRLTADGSGLIHRIEVRMVYCLNRTPQRDETIQICYLPTVKFKPADRLLDRSAIYRPALGPAWEGDA